MIQDLQAQVQPERLDLLVTLERQALQEQQAMQAIPDPLVQQVMLAIQAQQVLQVLAIQVQRVTLALLAQQVMWVRQAPLVTQAQVE